MMLDARGLAWRVLMVVWVLLPGSGLPAAEPAARRETFDARGVKLQYLVQGTAGEPVLLLHGLYASAELNWVGPGIMAALAKDHRVIALDLPGHGGSDKPLEEEAYGMRMVEDVVLLLDHLKIKKAHVVGYSMGGMITMKLMVMHPDRVISGVVGGWGWMKAGSPLEKMWEHMGMGGVSRRGAPGAAAGNQAAGAPGATTAPAPGTVAAALAAGGVCMRCFGQFAVTEDQIKAIRVPVTVLVGERDPVKRLYVEPLQAVRKDWPVTTISGVGHLICVIKPEFREGIVKWVAEHGGKP